MRGQAGFWDLDERGKQQSSSCGPLDKFNASSRGAATGQNLETPGQYQGLVPALCAVSIPAPMTLGT